MRVYLVGGAVRDELLGRPVTERDWVVVGSSPQQMRTLGFRPVGREFPVFLHPQTQEEYALARLERKVAPGYRGFVTEFSPQVTLEQDLRRRDLTINAMARAEDGRLIDPYGGERDIRERRLRHVSAAFVEDPVRVLRVARFAARYAELGFGVAPETLELMRHMGAAGELRALVPERVWRELERALGEPRPEAFFDTLRQCGALEAVLPGLPWGEPERRALQSATRLSPETTVRFAALLAHAAPGAVERFCEQLRCPGAHRELALLGAQLCARLAEPGHPTPQRLLELMEAADALRRPERFGQLLLACEARGVQAARLELLRGAQRAFASAALPPEQLASLSGPQIAAALRRLRLERLEALASQPSPAECSAATPPWPPARPDQSR